MTDKLIKNLPVVELQPEMLIPTGGFGDISINFEQVKEYVRAIPPAYKTTDPNIKVKNGNAQILDLTSNQKLEIDFKEGEFVYLIVNGDFNLDLSSFTVVGNFTKSSKSSFIVAVRFIDEALLFGSNFNCYFEEYVEEEN